MNRSSEHTEGGAGRAAGPGRRRRWMVRMLVVVGVVVLATLIYLAPPTFNNGAKIAATREAMRAVRELPDLAEVATRMGPGGVRVLDNEDLALRLMRDPAVAEKLGVQLFDIDHNGWLNLLDGWGTELLVIIDREQQTATVISAGWSGRFGPDYEKVDQLGRGVGFDNGDNLIMRWSLGEGGVPEGDAAEGDGR